MSVKATDMGLVRQHNPGSKMVQGTGDRGVVFKGKGTLEGVIIQGTVGTDPIFRIWDQIAPQKGGGRKLYDGKTDADKYGNSILGAINFYGMAFEDGIMVTAVATSSVLCFLKGKSDFK